ncbi:hypothetical protein, partial [Burkholderia pseudomallei]|uniref:hypothetical protein n=1 Tax=Burkholderia pseudomallei TaxID=28450 RepID=UPI001C3E5582
EPTCAAAALSPSGSEEASSGMRRVVAALFDAFRCLVRVARRHPALSSSRAHVLTFSRPHVLTSSRLHVFTIEMDRRAITGIRHGTLARPPARPFTGPSAGLLPPAVPAPIALTIRVGLG